MGEIQFSLEVLVPGMKSSLDRLKLASLVLSSASFLAFQLVPFAVPVSVDSQLE